MREALIGFLCLCLNSSGPGRGNCGVAHPAIANTHTANIALCVKTHGKTASRQESCQDVMGADNSGK